MAGATSCGCACSTVAGVVFRTSKSSGRLPAPTAVASPTTAGTPSPSRSARPRLVPAATATATAAGAYTFAWTSTVGRWPRDASTTSACRGRRRHLTSTVCPTCGSVGDRPPSRCSRQATVHSFHWAHSMGHSGSLCHALSLSSSWTSMRRRRATVPVATPVSGREAALSREWAQHFSNASCLYQQQRSDKLHTCHVDTHMYIYIYTCIQRLLHEIYFT